MLRGFAAWSLTMSEQKAQVNQRGRHFLVLQSGCAFAGVEAGEPGEARLE